MPSDLATGGRRCVRATVSGRVQGVSFRAGCQQRASELGCDGWVRNTAGGEVELLAAGQSGAVAHLLDWCGQGPPAARVSGVDVQDLPVDGEAADPAVPAAGSGFSTR